MPDELPIKVVALINGADKELTDISDIVVEVAKKVEVSSQQVAAFANIMNEAAQRGESLADTLNLFSTAVNSLPAPIVNLSLAMKEHMSTVISYGEAFSTAGMDIQKYGKMQEIAFKENEARDQRLGQMIDRAIQEMQKSIQAQGRMMDAAIKENQARTQRDGKMQEAALKENMDRDQKMGRMHEAALKEMQTFIQRWGAMMEKAAQENQDRDQKQGQMIQRATAEMERDLQARGRMMETAAQENLARDQRMGRMMEAAQAENEKRDRKNFEKFAEGVKDFIQNPLRAAGNAAEATMLSFGALGTGIVAGTVIFAGLAKAITDVTLGMARLVREDQNLADRLGLTLGQAEALSSMARISQVNIRSLEYTSRQLAMALEEPMGAGRKAAQALSELSIKTHDVNGAVRDLGPVLLEVLSQLANIENTSERVTKAQELMGRNTKEILPLIVNLRELREVVDQLGVSLNENATKQLLDANRRANELTEALRLLKRQAAEKIAPIIVPIIRVITDIVSGKDKQTPGAMAQGEAGMGYGGDFDPYKNQIDVQADLVRRFAGTSQQMSKAVWDLINQNLAAGKAIGDAVKKEFMESEEGIKLRIKELQESRTKLRAALASGLTQEAATANKAEYDRQTAEQKRLEESLKKPKKDRSDDIEFQAERRSIENMFAMRRDYYNHLAEMGRMSKEDSLKLIADADQKEMNMLVTLLNDKLNALDKNDPDYPTNFARLAAQRDKLQEDLTRRRVKANYDAEESQKKLTDSILRELEKTNEAIIKGDEQRLKKFQQNIEERGRIHERGLKTELNTELRHLEELSKLEQRHNNDLYELGRMSDSKRLVANDAIQQQFEELQRRRINQELNTLSSSDKEYYARHAELMQKLQELDDRAANRRAQLESELVKIHEQKFKAVFSGVTSAFEGSVKGLLQGTLTFQAAWARLGQGVVMSWADSLVKVGMKHAENLAMRLALEHGFSKILVALHLEDAATAAAVGATKREAEITGAAAVAFANAFAATAAIPVVGPELAPGVASGAMAAVLAMLPMGAAERGALLAQDQLMLLHKEEMVLPPHLSKGVQNMIDGGSSGASMSQGPTKILIQAWDGQDVIRTLHRHAPAVVGAAKSYYRNGGRV